MASEDSMNLEGVDFLSALQQNADMLKRTLTIESQLLQNIMGQNGEVVDMPSLQAQLGQLSVAKQRLAQGLSLMSRSR